MSKLVKNALSSAVTPKVIGAVVTAGFAAAGVAAVVAQNLRTLGESDEPLRDRAKRIGQTSLGAVLTGPSGLVARGKSLRETGADTTPADAPDVPVRSRSQDPDGAAKAVQEPRSDAKSGSEKDGGSAGDPGKPTAKTGTSAATTDDQKADDRTGRSQGKSEAKDEGPSKAAITADLELMTVAQLRDRAKNDGLPGRSNMNKSELIAALSERESTR